MAKIAQILVAAGQGHRAGGQKPKQYQDIAGKPLLLHTLEALAQTNPDIQVIVHADGHEAWLDMALADYDRPVMRIKGGTTRTASVKAGLAALAEQAPDYVFIHDAARPFVSFDIMEALTTALQTASAVVPVLPLSDAIKSFENNGLQGDIQRENLRRVQTPQAFDYPAIYAAFTALSPEASYPDDIAVAHAAGLSIATVEGDEDNFKVTYPQDFAKAETMLASDTYTATGSGYDVHRFTRGDGVWLCGVKIPAEYTLLGHSDADAGLHALTDAILGALAEGDIGDHFPPSDPQWKDASSDRFLVFALEKIQHRGGQLHHIDLTLICEKPKIKPHREAMRMRLSELTGLPLTRISVKATTTEKLGFTGREEGLAAQAIATVTFPAS